jgi:CBS domain-containing protein
MVVNVTTIAVAGMRHRLELTWSDSCTQSGDSKEAGHVMPNSEKAMVPVRSVHSDDSLQRVAEIMWKHDCAYVLVVDTAGQPTGMMTARELCRAVHVQDKPLAQIKVSSVSARTLFAAQRIQSSKAPEHLNVRGHAHRVPIVDDMGSLINVVTVDSLVRYIRKFRTQRIHA